MIAAIVTAEIDITASPDTCCLKLALPTTFRGADWLNILVICIHTSVPVFLVLQCRRSSLLWSSFCFSLFWLHGNTPPRWHGKCIPLFWLRWSTAPWWHGESSNGPLPLAKSCTPFPGLEKFSLMADFASRNKTVNAAAYGETLKIMQLAFENKTGCHFCLVMVSFSYAAMPGHMPLLWHKISLSPSVRGTFYNLKLI